MSIDYIRKLMTGLHLNIRILSMKAEW